MDANNRHLFNACHNDPAYFAEQILGVNLAEYQRAGLQLLATNKSISIRSCHGVGKTFLVAIIALWFLYTRPNSKVITTAPTLRQVRDLLWAEISALYYQADRNGFNLGGTLSKTRLDIVGGWYATGISSDRVENYLGYHAPHILFIADEASGVSEEILDAVKGYGTNADSYEFLIGNATQNTGGFHASHNAKKALWATMKISAFDSPNFTEERVADFPLTKSYMTRHKIPYANGDAPDRVKQAVVAPQYVETALKNWGETHPLFVIKVLGDFAAAGEDTVCALNRVEAAQARFKDWTPPEDVPRTADVMCDVARFGTDETVIGAREHGDTIDRVSILEVATKQDLMETCGRILYQARALEKEGVKVRRVIVDDAGLGGGVTDRLKELAKRDGTRAASHAYEVVAFNGGHSPKSKHEYPNRRSEAWFCFADALENIALQPDAQLLADLVAPTYQIDSHGRRVVEPKAATKKRLTRSPDRADTVLMGHAPITVVRGRRSKRKVYK